MSTSVTTETREPESTQWEDIHRRLGNFVAKPKLQSRNEIQRLCEDAGEMFDPLAEKSLKGLEAVEDDVEEDELEKYRKERLAEMKAKRAASKFGDVRHIRRDDFVAEVTDASANGQWVLCLLFADGTACQHLLRIWESAAKKFPTVKFLKGVAEEVIPDFPSSRTPTVLVYHDKDCHKQIVGINEWGGSRCDLQCIEWVLSMEGIIETDLEDDPRIGAGQPVWQRAGRSQEESESDSDRDQDDRAGDQRRDDRCYGSMKIENNLARGGYGRR